MPIQREQLSLQIDRMVDVWGEKAFSDQRELSIWETVEGLEYSQVISIVDGFIRTSRYAPLPQDFKEASREFTRATKRYALGENWPHDLALCKDCLDSGFCYVTRNENYEPWATAPGGNAPCHCNQGKRLIEAARRKNTDLGGQFGPHWENSYRLSSRGST